MRLKDENMHEYEEDVNKIFKKLIGQKIKRFSVKEGVDQYFHLVTDIEVIYQNNKKDSGNSPFTKTVKNSKTINNRIHHPEYWKTLKGKNI